MKSLREEIEALPPAEPFRVNPLGIMTSEEFPAVSAWSLEFEAPTQEKLSPQDFQLKVIIGQDDRRQVPDATQFPWNRICCLLLLYGSGARAIGTGWLAGPRTVITAGHCVFQQRFGWATSVQVIPGWNGGPPSSAPFGVHVSTQCTSVTGWVQQQQSAFDYGAVILPPESAIGGPDIPFVAAPDSVLQNIEVVVAGYPTDKPPGTMWFHAGPLTKLDPTFLTYDIDTEGGQSGTALLTFSPGGGYVAVGIHTDGSSQGNFGVRITQGIEAVLNTWLHPA